MSLRRAVARVLDAWGGHGTSGLLDSELRELDVEARRSGWTHISTALPEGVAEDYGAWTESRNVLAVVGSGWVAVVRLQRWEEGRELRWVLAGRDGYAAENVTHWRELPAAPR